MNIPNLITIFRFILVPFFFYTFYSMENFALAMLIFIFAGLTDILDGYIARKFNKVTNLGKLLDPLADKLMQISVLFVLTQSGLIPIWIIIVILIKEIFLVIGSGILYKNKVVAEANWYGKVTTVAFYIAIAIFVLVNKTFGIYALMITVILTLYSASRYTIYYLKITNRLK